jgi:hypothetical protein
MYRLKNKCPWMPIETAPKDGTLVDLWTFNGRIAYCKFVKNEWVHWWMDEFGSFGWVNISEFATHWMPIPQAPKK